MVSLILFLRCMVLLLTKCLLVMFHHGKQNKSVHTVGSGTFLYLIQSRGRKFNGKHMFPVYGTAERSLKSTKLIKVFCLFASLVLCDILQREMNLSVILKQLRHSADWRDRRPHTSKMNELDSVLKRQNGCLRS